MKAGFDVKMPEKLEIIARTPAELRPMIFLGLGVVLMYFIFG